MSDKDIPGWIPVEPDEQAEINLPALAPTDVDPNVLAHMARFDALVNMDEALTQVKTDRSKNAKPGARANRDKAQSRRAAIAVAFDSYRLSRGYLPDSAAEIWGHIKRHVVWARGDSGLSDDRATRVVRDLIRELT